VRSKPMTQSTERKKIAVAVVHGMGNQDADFIKRIEADLRARTHDVCGDDVVIRPVYWAEVMRKTRNTLWQRTQEGGELDYDSIRTAMIHFLGDALAYQPAPKDRSIYDDMHTVYTQALHHLAQEAGETAPLVIIAHSFGTIITSNFLYDLQHPAIISEQVRDQMHDSPLEKGETLVKLFTLGSPLALWSLRYSDFGVPIDVPVSALDTHHPTLREAIDCGWVNYYDKDDVIAFPIKTLNEAYEQAVSADYEVNVGNFMASWNPLSHLYYWTDDDVMTPIATYLCDLWRALNG
jgi:hypothetical protein